MNRIKGIVVKSVLGTIIFGVILAGTAYAAGSFDTVDDDRSMACCNDGVDNDCDGLVDCADSDCADITVCRCVDADGDGYYANMDCGTELDPDDDNANINPGADEICDDGIDNNGDRLIDCADSACEDHPECVITWYVWYANNMSLKPVMVGTNKDFERDTLCSSYPGGGMSPTLMVEKVAIVSDAATREKAIAEACKQFDNIRRVPGSSTFVFSDWLGDLGGERHDIDELGGCE